MDKAMQLETVAAQIEVVQTNLKTYIDNKTLLLKKVIEVEKHVQMLQKTLYNLTQTQIYLLHSTTSTSFNAINGANLDELDVIKIEPEICENVNQSEPSLNVNGDYGEPRMYRYNNQVISENHVQGGPDQNTLREQDIHQNEKRHEPGICQNDSLTAPNISQKDNLHELTISQDNIHGSLPMVQTGLEYSTFARQNIEARNSFSSHTVETEENYAKEISQVTGPKVSSQVLTEELRQCNTQGVDFSDNPNGGGVGFVCRMCQKTFPTRQTLSMHRCTPDPSTLHACQLCTRHYSSLALLQIHIQHWHPQNNSVKQKDQPAKSSEPTLYPCKFCSEMFGILEDYHYHCQEKHIDEEYYECYVPGIKLVSPGSLELHQQLQAPVLTYFCTVCRKRYSDQDHMKQHTNSHKATFIPCAVCSSTFENMENLLNHMKLSHCVDGASFVDKKQCGESFGAASSSSLKVNEAVYKAVHESQNEKMVTNRKRKLSDKSLLEPTLKKPRKNKKKKENQKIKKGTSKKEKVNNDKINQSQVTVTKSRKLKCKTCFSGFGSAKQLRKHKCQLCHFNVKKVCAGCGRRCPNMKRTHCRSCRGSGVTNGASNKKCKNISDQLEHQEDQKSSSHIEIIKCESTQPTSNSLYSYNIKCENTQPTSNSFYSYKSAMDNSVIVID